MSPVTVESSQPAPEPTPNTEAAPAAGAPAAPKSAADNQSVRIAALVVLGIVLVGVVGYLIFGHSDKKKNANLTTAIGPNAWQAPRLHTEATTLGQPFYWAGPKSGMRYEFTRTTGDRIFLRYLPKGIHSGDKGAFLTIATYAVPGAYSKVKETTGSKTGPNGSVYWVRPNNPKNVLIAFPKVPYEVEVFDPKGAVAAVKVAKSGNVTTVGG